MTIPKNAEPAAEAPAQAMPPEPLTIEGASVLHQIMRFDWPAWGSVPPAQQAEIIAEAIPVLERMEQNESGQSALFSVLGHKGDLLLLHYRNSFDDLNRAELHLARLSLAEFLEPSASFLSVVELGLYDSSMRVYRSLAERGIAPYSPEWNAEVESVLAMQRKAMQPRLYPKMPQQRYLCFYPMDRRRGEQKNW